MKNYSNKKQIFLAMIFIIISEIITYGGMIEEKDGIIKYKTKNGEYAKNTWVWLDINNDSISECYRFNDEGEIAKNYEGHDGRKTNEKGQLIENKNVIRKYASGKIFQNENKPEIKKEERDGKIITNGAKDIKIDAIGENNTIIYTTKIKDAIEIPIEENKTKIIYAKDDEKEVKDIIAGKDLRKYIIEKNEVEKEVEKARIFNGETWEDVIKFRGNNSYIKINMKDFNYIYFEIAEEKHYIDKENEETAKLYMYVDDKLYDIYDEFVEDDPQIIEEMELQNIKTIELRLKIEGKNKDREIYIRNGRLRKMKEGD